MKHAWQTGLMRFGSETKQALLDEAKVSEIMELFLLGANNQEIANMFGVVRGTVSKIRQRKTWKHVRPELIFQETSVTKHSPKLTAEDIPKIRKLSLEGNSNSEIAEKYKVHNGTIHGILSGKTWRNY